MSENSVFEASSDDAPSPAANITATTRFMTGVPTFFPTLSTILTVPSRLSTMFNGANLIVPSTMPCITFACSGLIIAIALISFWICGYLIPDEANPSIFVCMSLACVLVASLPISLESIAFGFLLDSPMMNISSLVRVFPMSLFGVVTSGEFAPLVVVPLCFPPL